MQKYVSGLNIIIYATKCLFWLYVLVDQVGIGPSKNPQMLMIFLNEIRYWKL